MNKRTSFLIAAVAIACLGGIGSPPASRAGEGSGARGGMCRYSPNSPDCPGSLSMGLAPSVKAGSKDVGFTLSVKSMKLMLCLDLGSSLRCDPDLVYSASYTSELWFGSSVLGGDVTGPGLPKSDLFRSYLKAANLKLSLGKDENAPISRFIGSGPTPPRQEDGSFSAYHGFQDILLLQSHLKAWPVRIASDAGESWYEATDDASLFAEARRRGFYVENLAIERDANEEGPGAGIAEGLASFQLSCSFKDGERAPRCNHLKMTVRGTRSTGAGMPWVLVSEFPQGAAEAVFSSLAR
jgi:hypothetical protein